MVSLETPVCEFDLPAQNFDLPGVDGRNWAFGQCLGEKGLLVDGMKKRLQCPSCECSDVKTIIKHAWKWHKNHPNGY